MKDTHALIYLLAVLCAPLTLAQTSAAPPASSDRLDPPFYTKLLPPPGPIEETMKTLQQVEPRTPANDLGGDMDWAIIIDQPGSYYLTENVVPDFGKNGISIRAEPVTLDLNGFKVDGKNNPMGTNGAGSIGISASSSSVVINGTVMNWNYCGISTGSCCRLIGIQANFCGEAGSYSYAILASEGSTIRDCHVTGSMAFGIGVSGGCILERCVVVRSELVGIIAQASLIQSPQPNIIRDCVVIHNRGGGIAAVAGTQIEGCISSSNEEFGYQVHQGVTISGCTSFLDQAGFVMLFGSKAIDCIAQHSVQYGFQYAIGSVLERCVASSCLTYGFASWRNSGAGQDARLIECVAFDSGEAGFLLDANRVILRDCTASRNALDVEANDRADSSVIDGCDFFSVRCEADDLTIKDSRIRSLDITGQNNLVIRNIFPIGAKSITIAPGNRDADIINHPNDAGPWSNLAY